MKTGQPVPGIHTEGVFFVDEDQFSICDRIKEYDPDSRLVVNVLEDHKLGVARFVKDQKWAPGGAWVIAFWANDQVTGEALTGEPDARVSDLQRKFDGWSNRNQEKAATRARRALMLRELRRAQEQRDNAGAIAEKSVHRWKELRGVKHKIFVPSSMAV